MDKCPGSAYRWAMLALATSSSAAATMVIGAGGSSSPRCSLSAGFPCLKQASWPR